MSDIINLKRGVERLRINPKKIIKLLNIEKILSKYPHQISAGEAQRAALAR